MERLAQGLRAVRGAVAAAGYDAIDRDRFADFAQAANMATEFTGARGMGFIRQVPAHQLDDFLAEAREEGPPDFHIRRLGDPLPDAAFVIQYVEPYEPNREAVGLDIASEPNRREAAMRSVRLNAPAITAPITLVQASQAPLQSVLVLLPIFQPHATLATEADRLAATVGWAYAPLQIEQVLTGLAPPNGLFDFQLDDLQANKPAVQLARSGPAIATGRHVLRQTLKLPVMGRDWQLLVQARPVFVRQLNQYNPVGVGFALVLGWSLAVGVWWLMQATRQKSQALVLQESRMAALVAQSEDAVLAIDLQGRITDWNPAAMRIFGYTSEEALGQVLERLLVPPRLQREAHHALDRAKQGEPVPPFDTVRLRKDGSEVQVSISISPVRDATGQVVGAAKISRDISDRKAAEARILELNTALAEEVKQTRRREQALLDQALSTVIVTDATGRITLFNRAAEQLLGYSAEEVVGREVMTRFHDEEEVRHRVRAASRQLGRKLAPGEVFLPHIRHAMGDRNEWLYVHKDGTRIPMLLTVGALHDEQNRPTGFIGIGSDLRERKKLEADLSMAEKAGRAKDRFLANMSHEMRTPLNAIVGLTYLLSKGNLDSSQQDLLAKTRQATRALLALINDVLDLSKIEAGEMALQPHPAMLKTLLVEAVSLAAASTVGKPVQVLLEAGEDVQHTVLVDALRLQQILGNLLGNAIKFTAEGKVVLRASATPGDDQTLAVRLEVEDTGPGIPEEAQQRLFRRFTQAGPDIARQYGGTGLGLSIVRNLAKLMGGQVGLHSAPGQGSTFWLELPLPLVADDVLVRPATPSLVAGAQRLSGLRVLVVDDSAINREVVERILALEGAAVSHAENGDLALDQLRSSAQSTHLVLLDMQMPGSDGPTVAKAIRAMASTATLPILALTASALQSERERALQSGMNDFVVKPFEPDDLVQRILQHTATRPITVPASPLPALAAAQPDKLAGDDAWKRKLVQKLLDDHADWLANDPALALSGDVLTPPENDQLRQRLHRLKGSAGMLGLDAVYRAADQAEQSLQESPTANAGPAPINWLALRHALQHAAASLRSDLAAAADQSATEQASAIEVATTPVDPAVLLQLLAQNSLDAVDAFQRLRPSLVPHLEPAHLARMDAAIQNLDFSLVRQELVRAGVGPADPPATPPAV
jgi:PAS domain S-box-containing protein